MKLLLFLAVLCVRPLRAQEPKDSVNKDVARMTLSGGLMKKTLTGAAGGIGSAVLIGLPAAIIFTKKSSTAIKVVASSYILGTAWGIVYVGKKENGNFILTMTGATAGLYTGLYLSRKIGSDNNKKWVMFDFSPSRLIPYLAAPLCAALCYNLTRKPNAATVDPVVDPHSKTFGLAASYRF